MQNLLCSVRIGSTRLRNRVLAGRAGGLGRATSSTVTQVITIVYERRLASWHPGLPP